MTPLDPPREPRVNDNQLACYIEMAGSVAVDELARDLRDARRTIAELAAENARLLNEPVRVVKDSPSLLDAARRELEGYRNAVEDIHEAVDLDQLHKDAREIGGFLGGENVFRVVPIMREKLQAAEAENARLRRVLERIGFSTPDKEGHRRCMNCGRDFPGPRGHVEGCFIGAALAEGK